MLRIADSKYYNDKIWIKKPNAVGDLSTIADISKDQETIELK